jgi:hypothetical protein
MDLTLKRGALLLIAVALGGCASFGGSKGSRPTPVDFLIKKTTRKSAESQPQLTKSVNRDLRSLAAKCPESKKKLTGLVYGTWVALKHRGAHEDIGSLARHLDKTVRRSGAGPCARRFGTYVVLRTH